MEAELKHPGKEAAGTVKQGVVNSALPIKKKISTSYLVVNFISLTMFVPYAALLACLRRNFEV